jgi:phosphoglycolate phosphatase
MTEDRVLIEEAMAADSSSLLVATAKPREYAERIVTHFGLDRHFAGVYGAELGGQFDHKADLLAHLLASEGMAVDAVVMVGDRASDVVAARVNGLRSVGVLWGYGSEAELTGAGADALCARPQALPQCLSRVAALTNPPRSRTRSWSPWARS